MRKIRWRWVLSVVQLVLAATLLLVADVQHRAEENQRAAATATHDESGALVTQPISISHNVAPVRQLMIAINFIPFVLSAPFHRLVTPVGEGALLVAIGAFWWWFGRRIDRRHEPPAARNPLWSVVASGLALTVTAAGALSLSFSYWGHSPVAHFGAWLWCMGLSWYFARRFAAALRRAMAQQRV